MASDRSARQFIGGAQAVGSPKKSLVPAFRRTADYNGEIEGPRARCLQNPDTERSEHFIATDSALPSRMEDGYTIHKMDSATKRQKWRAALCSSTMPTMLHRMRKM